MSNLNFYTQAGDYGSFNPHLLALKNGGAQNISKVFFPPLMEGGLSLVNSHIEEIGKTIYLDNRRTRENPKPSEELKEKQRREAERRHDPKKVAPSTPAKKR